MDAVTPSQSVVVAASNGEAPRGPGGGVPRVALVGNPNTGKTTLFNRLTGLRHHTSNFPGTTVEARVGLALVPGEVEIIDLPGIYSLELDLAEAEVCRQVLAGRAAPKGEATGEPDGVMVVLDAMNLGRNLMLAGEALRRRLPTLVVVNMIDLAEKHGLKIDTERLARAMGCRVVVTSARAGRGIDELRTELTAVLADGAVPTRTPPGDDAGLRAWADEVCTGCTVAGGHVATEELTDKLDRVLTHPVVGSLAFVVIMAGLFAAIFSLAQFPMSWIEWIFDFAGKGIEKALPAGLVCDLLKDGVLAGVGATLIFLPQICLLFFLISVLEDTGYLARAAFVMDRVLRPFGLPGHAFVPLLSSHACALPGIMSTRTIPDRRERLATILVAPFMTCSARIPVYVLLTGLLFPHSPLGAALAFIGCYALGIFAAVVSALIARRTILRGASRPMALELPSYKRPSLRTALLTTYDRAKVFVRKAGTSILAISIVLWWLGAFPRVEPPAQVAQIREQAVIAAQTSKEKGEELAAQADRMEHAHAKRESMIGHLGRTFEPVFRPLGYDWQLTVGVLASFAAREVFVGTMSILVTGEDSDKSDAQQQTRLRDELAQATRTDGKTLIFTAPTAWSLLVYYVLAMQCLPTLVVTAREAGNAKWALLQLVWMSGMAYVAAMVVHAVAVGVG